MKLQKIDQMRKVTEAKYLCEFQKIKGILDEETRLRRELAKLKTQAATGRRDVNDQTSMQTIGADILWQGWVARTQRNINIELSRVLAKKLTAMGKVRKAFGRKHAVEIMSEAIQTDRKRRLGKKAEEDLL